MVTSRPNGRQAHYRIVDQSTMKSLIVNQIRTENCFAYLVVDAEAQEAGWSTRGPTASRTTRATPRF